MKAFKKLFIVPIVCLSVLYAPEPENDVNPANRPFQSNRSCRSDYQLWASIEETYDEILSLPKGTARLPSQKKLQELQVALTNCDDDDERLCDNARVISAIHDYMSKWNQVYNAGSAALDSMVTERDRRGDLIKKYGFALIDPEKDNCVFVPKVWLVAIYLYSNNIQRSKGMTDETAENKAWNLWKDLWNKYK